MTAADPNTVADLGEFGLIARLSKLLPAENPQLLVGIGDDACAFLTEDGHCLLLTTDVLIEDVHFHRGWGTWQQVGKKAMAASLSDIAAMGGKPLWALVSLAVEPNTPVSIVDDLYQGMREVANQAAAEICGGDTVRSPSGLLVGVTLLGECRGTAPVQRRGAQPGDLLLLTGSLGASRAGLALLQQGANSASLETRNPQLETAVVQQALKAHLEPQARCREGMILAEAGVANSMIDISDGLLADLEHIRAASGVGAKVDSRAVPVSPCCQTIAAALAKDPLAWALEGGEDYELLFTCPPNRAQEAKDLLRSAGAAPLTTIGSITEGKEIEVLSYDRNLAQGGYRHF